MSGPISSRARPEPQPGPGRRRTFVTPNARRRGDRAGDPLEGLVNLFDLGIVLAVAFLLAALASAGLAIWQAFTLWFKKESPEQKTVTLNQQHRLLSYVLMAAGLAFIVLAFFLGFGKKPGGSTGFTLGWPAVRNYNVYWGGPGVWRAQHG